MPYATKRRSRRHVLRIAAATLAAGAVAGLAACGGSTSAGSAPSATSAAPVAAAPSTAAGATTSAAASAASAAAAPASGPAHLTLVTWGAVDETSVRQKYVAQFVKSNPSIQVTFTPTPSSNYWDTLQTRMAGGDAPDVYYLEPAHVVDLQCRGALLDLTPYVQRDKYDLTDYYPAGPLEYTVGGKLWGLNRDFANQDVFYNVDLFQKAGVPLPPQKFDATGWTFNDFLAASQKITSGSGPTKTYGFAVPQGYRAYLAFVWSNGGDIVSADNQKPAIDQPNAVEGIQFLEDLIGKYKVSPAPADIQSQNVSNLFYTGRIAMVIDIPANLGNFRQGVKSFKWDVAPPPLGPHGTKRQVGGGGAGYGVYGKTKAPDQSWQLMQWVTSVEVQKQEVDAGTSMGSRLSVGDYFVKVNQGKEPSNVQMFVDASKNSLHTDPHAANWLQIQNIMSKEMADIWDASKPAKDVTAAIAGQMAPLLLQGCAG